MEKKERTKDEQQLHSVCESSTEANQKVRQSMALEHWPPPRQPEQMQNIKIAQEILQQQHQQPVSFPGKSNICPMCLHSLNLSTEEEFGAGPYQNANRTTRIQSDDDL